jgi:hypothetical protein
MYHKHRPADIRANYKLGFLGKVGAMNLIARHTLRTAGVGIAAMLIACSGPTSGSCVADEAAIREADAASLRAIAAKQVDATVSYYDEQASILMPNAPTVTGREGIRKAWEQMFAIPGFNFAPKNHQG